MTEDSSTGPDIDRRYLARAIELAEQGRGRVSPNPLVGAVIATEQEKIAEGYHAAWGGPHAEIEAIEAAAGRNLDRATLYVSLEPCCHRGKTPPCTEAIRESGIRRVVIACEDPSAHASGRGLGIMRDEGIEVVLADGELARRARILNQPFRKWARTGRPWVLFKSAMSLDGKVATQAGDSKWISGESSRYRAHHWRAECDAVAIGIGTALADDPQLTARVKGVHRQPRRIVFDSLARLPADSKLLRDSRRVPLTVVVSRAAPRAAIDMLETHGAEVIVAPGENETARVISALDQLGAAGISSILLEGGPHLAGAFLDAGEIDEVRLFVAPIVLGGRSARGVFEGEGAEGIPNALRARALDVEQIDDDLLLSARLREW